MVLGYLTSTNFSQVDGLSTGPFGFGASHGTFGTSAKGDDACPFIRALAGDPCSLADGDGEEAPNFGVLPRSEQMKKKKKKRVAEEAGWATAHFPSFRSRYNVLYRDRPGAQARRGPQQGATIRPAALRHGPTIWLVRGHDTADLRIGRAVRAWPSHRGVSQ